MNNNRGSVLGFVIVVMMVLMILVTGALSLVASSSMRSQRRHNRAQAEMTAETMAEALAQEFINTSGNGSVCSLILEAVNQEPEITIPLEGLDPEMGAVTWEIYYNQEEGLLRIVVCVELGGIRKETAVVFRERTADESGNDGFSGAGSWEVLRFEDGRADEEELR